MNPDKRDELYNNLINSGKVSEAEIGSLDDFKAAIKDEESARLFYQNLMGSGIFGADEIGSEDDFYSSISSDFAGMDTPEQATTSNAQGLAVNPYIMQTAQSQGTYPYGGMDIAGVRKPQKLPKQTENVTPEQPANQPAEQPTAQPLGPERFKKQMEMQQQIGQMAQSFSSRMDAMRRDNTPFSKQVDALAPARQKRVQEERAKVAEDDLRIAMLLVTQSNAAVRDAWVKAAFRTEQERKLGRFVGNEAARLKYHDLDRMSEEAWNSIDENTKQRAIRNVAQVLREDYGMPFDEARTNAEKIVRGESDRMMYDEAVKSSAPKNWLDYLTRKINENAFANILEGWARSKAGTVGDMQAREAAEEQYRKENWLGGMSGEILGFAARPENLLFGGAAGAAGKGVASLLGKEAAEKLIGKIAQQAVTSSLNLGTFFASDEATTQFKHGGVMNEDGTIGDYSLKNVGEAAKKGALTGLAIGPTGQLIGNAGKRLTRATESTIGKVAVRGGQELANILAEGTIFVAPEMLKGELTFDDWLGSVGMMAGFKLQGGMKSAPERIRELAGKRGNSRQGFETRLRTMLDRDPSMALTKDEKAELERGGYNDIKELVEDYKNTSEDQRKAIETKQPIFLEPNAEGEIPYNRFIELVEDKNISEAARAKMYYYVTGHGLPMSTVLGSTFTEHKDANGNVTGYEVQSLGLQNGVITSRNFKNRKEAELELERINRQAELNGVAMGEQAYNADGDRQRMDDAYEIVARRKGITADNAGEILRNKLQRKPEELNEMEKEWAQEVKEVHERLPREDYQSADKLREDIDKKYNVNINDVISKEPNRRSDAEEKALKEYVSKLAGFKEAQSNAMTEASERGYEADEQGRREAMMKLAMSDPSDPNRAEKQAAVEGVNKRIEDDADMMVAEQRDLYNKEKNDDDGALHPASMTVDGEQREVYIKSGNVALDASGDIDIANSEETIVVYDPVQGKNVMISPQDLNGVGNVTTMEQFEEGLSAQREAYIQQQYDAATGRFNPQPGQEIDMPDGTKAQVLAVDGTDVTVQMPDGTQQSLPIAEVQRIADELAMRDYAERHPANANQEQPTAEAPGMTEGKPSTFEPYMELTINDGEGEKTVYVTGARARWIPDGFVEDPQGKYVELYDPQAADGNGGPMYIREDDPDNKIVGWRAAVQEQQPIEELSREYRPNDIDSNPPDDGGTPPPPPAAVGNLKDTKSFGEQPEEQRSSVETFMPESYTPEEPLTQPSPDAMPMHHVKRKINGKITTVEEEDWMATTPSRAYQYLYEEAVGLGLPVETADNILQANLKAAQKDVERAKKATGGIVTVLQKIKDAEAAVDYWQQVNAMRQAAVDAEQAEAAKNVPEEKPLPLALQQTIDRAKGNAKTLLTEAAEEMKNDAGALVLLEDMSPHTLEELVPDLLLGNSKHSPKLMFHDEIIDGRNIKGFSSMSGYSWKDVRQLPGIWAKRANGGMSLEQFGELIEQAARDHSVPFDENDATAGLNAALAFFGEVKTLGDMYDYAVKRRIERAEDYHAAALARAEDDWIAGHDGLTRAEYEEWERSIAEDAAALNGKKYDEFYNKIAESTLNEYDTRRETDDGRGQEAGIGTLQGPEVLQTTDTRDGSRGVEGSGSRDESGAAKPAAPDNTGAVEPQSSEDYGTTERNNTIQRPVGGGLREQPAGEAPRSGDGVDIVVLGKGLSPEQLGDYEKGSRAEQEAIGNQIIENAKQNGVFIERSSLNNYGQRVQQPSGESIVYIDEPGNRVVKVKDPFAKTNLKGHLAADALYEHVAHNLLFPNTPYRLLGISEGPIGDLRFVLEQDYLKDEYTPATQEQIDRYLTDVLGLQKVERPYLHYENDDISIADVDAGSDNVLASDGGELFFVDPIIKFKRPAKEVVDHLTTKANITAAEAETDTNPTEGQKKAGNYKMGHVTVDGYDISIENSKGSIRRGTDPNGRAWEQEMHNTYGYIRGTEGVDGDHIDVFLSDDPTQGNVFVVDQVNADGSFDEHKVMYGFPDMESAREAYLSNYEEGWQGLGTITEVSKDEFKKWVESSHRKTKPFSEYKSVKADGAQHEQRQPSSEKAIADIEAGGAVVDQLESMGVEVSTDIAENRRVRKQAEQDNSEAGKIHDLKNSEGKVYGFTYRGKLYLDPRKMDAELPLHEYGHLWTEAFRRLNPEGWNDLVETMKQDVEGWNIVKQLYPDLKSDSEIADEVIATFSGKNGADKLKEELERMADKNPDYKSRWGNIYNNIVKAIQDFWKAVGDFLGIKYESPEQVYDQVLRDFAAGMNPRARVEEYLKERDAEYMNAVESGDEDKAKELFDAALRENIGNGITPFVAVGGYRGNMDRLARGVKSRDPKVIAEVADLMAPLIPENAVLVPTPSHSGTSTDMLDVANAISKRTGAPVADVLRSEERKSQYEAKRQGQPITSAQMGIHVDGELPEGMTPVVIDNVVNTGNTAEACVKALGKGVVVSLADAANRYRHVASLKSANPIARDRNGKVVPLSQRFDLGGSNYLAKQKGIPAAPTEEQKTLTKGIVGWLNDIGIKTHAAVRKGQEVLNKYRELVRALRGYHGSAADFDRFDHSHMGEGEGNQAYGYGTYVTEVEGIGRGYAERLGNRPSPASYKGMTAREIENKATVDFLHKTKGEPEEFSEEKWDALLGIVRSLNYGYGDPKRMIAVKRESIEEAIKRAEKRLQKWQDKLQEADESTRESTENSIRRNQEGINELNETLDFVNSLNPDDFKGWSRSGGHYLYEVDIPEDNGSNYLDWGGYVSEAQYPMWYDAMKKLGEEDHFATPEERTPSKDGNTSVSVGFEIKAMGNRYTPEAVSKALHDAGLTGIKYPAQYMTGGREDNAKNYVIFDEGDIKIVDKIRFQRAADGEYEPKPTFYSNAMNAVEGIKQEKATAEQWLAMLQKNGGLKAGEDKWIGLSDWLNEQKGKSLTKQEVMDYIRKNAIQIEDVEYSDAKMPGNFASNLRNELNEKADEICGDVTDEYADMIAKAEDFSDELDDIEDEMIQEARHRLDDEFGVPTEHYISIQFENDRNRLVYTPTMSDRDFSNNFAQRVWNQLNGNESRPINETRLSYTTDFLDNRREIALVVPTIEPWNEDDVIHFGDAGEGRAVAWVRFGETTTIDAPEDIRKQAKDALKAVNDYQNEMREKYRGGYGVMTDDEKARYDQLVEEFRVAKERERNAGHPERVLVIDEIQSKRHQQGREKGYKRQMPIEGVHVGEYVPVKDKKYADRIAFADVLEHDDIPIGQIERIDGKYRPIDSGGQNIGFTDYDTEEEAVNAVKKAYATVEGIPDAPFDKNWHEVAFKRMLRYAAENGFDKVAWTTGEQQADRYDLGEKISKIDVSNNQDGTKLVTLNFRNRAEQYEDLYQFSVNDEGRVVSGDFADKELSDVVGKEMAKKIMAVDQPSVSFSGEDLRVGADGMKGFYDQILPRFADKYGKKWNVKTTDIYLPNIGDNGLTMHSVDVTPEMKASVLQGQPMFFRDKDGEVIGYTLNGEIYIDPRYAKPETPVHEYTHLIVHAIRANNPQVWERWKELAHGEQDVIDFVKAKYPEYSENEDDFWEEVISNYTGREGGKRLENEMRRQMRETPDIAEKARIATIFHKLRDLLRRFWDMTKDIFSGSTKGIDNFQSMDDVVDLTLAALANKFDPRAAQERARDARDKEYLDAVERGDMETAQRMVNEVAKTAMPKTKVVDENGEPLMVVHHTNNDFTEFDIDKLGTNSGDRGLYGKGFYFSTKGYGGIYGNRQMDVYLDIKHPLEIKGSLGDETDIYTDFASQFDKPELRDIVLSDYGKSITIGEYIDAIKAVDDEIAQGLHDERITQDEELQAYKPKDRLGIYREGLIVKRCGFPLISNTSYLIGEQIGSDEFTAALKKAGYDGVIVGKGEGVKEYIAFEPNQIKSADPVTYDDNGNVIPLSKRFDSESKDIRFRKAEEPRPIGRGAFGDIYDQFKGKAKEAIDFLMKKKGGEAIGALHHDETGDIDLVWGEEGSGRSDGYGLAKLAKYHPEVLNNLQEILDDMHVTNRSGNRVQLESDTHQATVRLTWDDQKKTWLLTAFEKKNSALDNTTDTGKTSEGGKRNDTATPQSTVSAAKVQQNSETAKNNLQDAENENGEQAENENALMREGDDIPFSGRTYEEALAEARAAGYTKKQFDAMIERSERNARKQFADWAEKLHLTDRITFVDNIDEVEGLTDEQREQRRDKKGWYDRRNGRIVILLDNHHGKDDVLQTILHEGVAHHGLRALFGKHFDDFLDNVYAAAEYPIREQITKLAKNHGWNIRTATEEYLATLAESTEFENIENSPLAGWWTKIKQFFLDMLHKLGIKDAFKYNRAVFSDNELRYILWRSYKNLTEPGRLPSFNDMAADMNKQYILKVGNFAEDNGERGEWYMPSRVAEGDDVMFREGEDTANILDDQSLGMQERMTAIATKVAALHADDATAKNRAYRAIGGNLADLRKAMSLQKEFDRSTVKRVADLARVLLSGGYLDNLSRYEISRLLSAVKNATGRSDIRPDVKKVMDIMVDNQLKRAEGLLHDLETVKTKKVNAKGVEVIGELDIAGQQIVEAFKKGRKLEKEGIEQQLADAQDRMGSENKAVADEAANEYTGLQFALEYAENIKDSENEEQNLRDELERARLEARDPNGVFADKEAYDQYRASVEEALRQNRVERLQAYLDLAGRLSGNLSQSIASAMEFKDAEKERIADIQHNANSDMEGRPSNEHYNPQFKDKFVNNSFVQFLFAPLSTFDQMLRLFGSKSANGEGYLYNRFMRGWVDAREKEIRGVRQKYATLDNKVKQLFGNEAQNTAQLIHRIGNMPKMKVQFWDGGAMRDHILTQGNLMYIYMADKMTDGRMKLRSMGVKDEDIAKVTAALDPRLIELADWIQNEFLVETRNEYNETHKRLFGASMAAIENYFPLKILANARVDKPEDLDNPKQTEGISTTTGSIIKRRRNALALDILNADALNVVLDHVAQMEHWNAFAEFNRDLNSLRTYKRFRNQVQNMTTIYGSGKELWKKFNDVSQMAAGTYRPPRAKLDEAAVNFAKGVTAAKVSFRVFTALKQFLSMPAYLPDARPDLWAKNLATPWNSWSWAMENLPIFEERWKSRMAGDPRLLKSELDWKAWRNNLVQLASKVGMSPNAFVDALTVSIGARTIYETRKARYLKEGYNEEQADRKAKQDAEVAYNETQQSSEGAFLSTMQVDRSWLSVMFTVFRNSSMAYQRQLHDALRKLKRDLKKGNREQSIEFMVKQMIREGVSEEKAQKAAEARYNSQVGKDILRVATFGFVLQLCWNLGAKLPYLLFGDDDDKKKEMMDDVWAQSMFGWGEGLTGGDVFSQAGKMVVQGEGNPEYLKKEMPLTSDAYKVLQEVGQGKYGEVVNDMVNLAVQTGIGVNPQSITDAVLAIMDACGDDPALAHEATIAVMRILQVPQSQIKEMYFDEIGLSGSEVSNYTPQQLAERYAQYQVKRGRLLAPWTWDDEGNLNKQRKKAEKEIKDRVYNITKEYNDLYDEYKASAKATGERINEAYNEAKQENDYVKKAQIIADVRTADEKAYRTYEDFKKYDKMLDDIAKKYLAATTPEQAALAKDDLVGFKSRMVELLGEEDEKQRRKLHFQLNEFYGDFLKEYSEEQ